MVKVIGFIENFDKNKSYPIEQSRTKRIPVYSTRCSCHYGYLCDDPTFDGIAFYIEVPEDFNCDAMHDQDPDVENFPRV